MSISLIVDILVVIFLALGTYAGWKKGLIKSLVNVVGLVAIIIVSYALKDKIALFLIDKLPFFNYGGAEGLTSLNILVYNVLSFIFVFVILYCALNIIIAITGFIDTLLKFTVIWVLPSKIGGAIIGFIETWLFLYLVLFVLGSFNVTAPYVLESKSSSIILDHTPVVGKMLGNAKDAMKDIWKNIDEYSKDDSKTSDDLNLKILQIEIVNKLISKEKAQELIDTGKIALDNVYFGEGNNNLWLNI